MLRGTAWDREDGSVSVSAVLLADAAGPNSGFASSEQSLAPDEERNPMSSICHKRTGCSLRHGVI